MIEIICISILTFFILSIVGSFIDIFTGIKIESIWKQGLLKLYYGMYGIIVWELVKYFI